MSRKRGRRERVRPFGEEEKAVPPTIEARKLKLA
jgi:hypothetical protein